MQDKLARLEDQMNKLLTDFRDAREKNEALRRENDHLLHDLMEKNRRLEIAEEHDSVLLEAEAEKKRLEEQNKKIREEVERLLKKLRVLRTGEGQ